MCTAHNARSNAFEVTENGDVFAGRSNGIDVTNEPLKNPTSQDVVSYLNSKIAKKTVTVLTGSNGIARGSTYELFGVANAHILSAYLEREPETLSAEREANVQMYGYAGYGIECKQGGYLMPSTNVTLTIFYTLI